MWETFSRYSKNKNDINNIEKGWGIWMWNHVEKFAKFDCGLILRTRDGNRSGRPAGRVASRVEILRPAGQAGWKTGQILLSGY